jgi:DNA-directed RNA polymerase subunit beta'
MALELFKPMIYSKLELYGMATTIKAAKRMVERERPEVWDILEEVIREHPVLLNRAPTLHRLGIQAFEPKLVEGKAIQLHPLVCTAFNADFDGDQMAVHVPLSLEAQLEARVLMMSTNNILSPANGKPIIVPTQDIILGLYHLSMERSGEKGEGMLFRGVGEAKQAIDQGIVSFNSKVKARWRWKDVNGEEQVTVYDTTPGRMVIGELLPSRNGMRFDEVNQVMTKKAITNLIDSVYRTCGQKDTVIFADRLMSLGFSTATLAGVSFGKDDMVIPPEKAALVDEAQTQVEQYERQYMDGLITQGEKYNKVVDAWSTTTDKVAAAMMKGIESAKPGEPINAVYMMAHSGARGSEAQIKQLAGMRGLMAKPSGEIIETPIISNFKEGLSVLEYFNSTHGARKGLADTALKTANSGYLTRRLVDVAQDCIVFIEDCGTQEGLDIRAVVEGGDVIEPLSERILGRTSAVDIVDPLSGEVLLKGGELIDEAKATEIEAAGVDMVKIRSALTCESEVGICGKCYGRDLARGTDVNIGEAVGVIAAQSIGEPGTQLTMRTFHIGGAAQRGAEQSSVEATNSGVVKVLNRNVVVDVNKVPVVMGRNVEVVLIDEAGRERARHRLPYGARILADEGVKVERGDKIAEWDPYTLPIIAEREGKAHFVDLVEGVSIREVMDEETGIASRVVVDWRQQARGADLKPLIALRDKKGEPIELAAGIEARYFLSVDAILNISNGQDVKPGDVLARIPRESTKTRDITGGLPRVAELFEARRPKDHAVLAESSGRVEFGRDYKTKRRIIVRDLEDPDQTTEYMIPKGRHVAVREGDMVERGDLLLDGNPAPHDILQVLGVEALAEYLVQEIQSVYRLQGVKINDKHIEVIVRQMLQKVEISDPGETTFLVGELVDRTEFDAVNKRAAEENLKLASATPVLQGITKASLQTQSWISAASFQETTRVLTDASTSGKIDTLNGLKENVIVGRLIPAGTGSVMNRVRRIAAERDRAILAERAALNPEQEALPAPAPEAAAE